MELENTNLSDMRARDILGHLVNILQEGWESFLIGKYIDGALKKQEDQLYLFFLHHR